MLDYKNRTENQWQQVLWSNESKFDWFKTSPICVRVQQWVSTAIRNCLEWISILLHFDKLLHLFTNFVTPIEIWGIAQDFCTSCLSHVGVAITDVLKGQFWTVMGIRGRNIVAFQTCSTHQKMISIRSFLTVREAFVWFRQGCILGRAYRCQDVCHPHYVIIMLSHINARQG